MATISRIETRLYRAETGPRPARPYARPYLSARAQSIPLSRLSAEEARAEVPAYASGLNPDVSDLGKQDLNRRTANG
jgi:hypothetical protein